MDMCDDKENAVPASANLQEAFRKFKKERQVQGIPARVQSCFVRVLVAVGGRQQHCHLVAIHALQAELQRRKEATLRAEAQCVDREKIETLRKSFLEKVLSYTGVPYAQRYHEPTCESPVTVCACVLVSPTRPSHSQA